jgi:hypothetical protein
MGDSCEHGNVPSGSVKDGQILPQADQLLASLRLCSVKLLYQFSAASVHTWRIGVHIMRKKFFCLNVYEGIAHHCYKKGNLGNKYRHSGGGGGLSHHRFQTQLAELTFPKWEVGNTRIRILCIFNGGFYLDHYTAGSTLKPLVAIHTFK